ncbi:glycosyltransferase family 4 protein [Methylobacterium frigidaeris]|uniref:D-inositol-3-phosphate glycosyltransferase n=1 Tax=Methylobacterium frigidaeris TaxID=2038277 RepID=A0AA37M4W9_9HYPH|nr:glycosyltransferase family 4 protein [Methylobacterium frigidaeris]PIK68931.1 glycosyl transferase family 1 [Methylobacterium frigidaeris]GJD62962.1 D-inositol-3-phosphate glycosyltransferase [Methylobacterium frigidaeris]
MTRIAFYAPLKAPDHPVPSGERTMARLFLRALAAAGFAPEVASSLRTRDPDGSRHPILREEALRQAARLVTAYRADPPALWFTYHVYYKAPDWIGPAVSRVLGIPYVVAEGSRAPKRAAGPHALGHAGAEAALDAADLVLVMNRRDRPALETARPGRQLLADLPPFLDPADWPLPEAGRAPGPLRLLTVAMMREGDKLASYRLLAEALAQLGDRPWILDVAGDGPAAAEVAALLAPFGPRVRQHGTLAPAGLSALYAAADLLVWPAVNEAYCVALLEAQAHGCPVVAGGYGGVPDVVRDRVTGRVAPPGDAAALAAAIRDLAAAPERLAAMRGAALAFAREERGLMASAALLRAALAPLLRERQA